MTLPPAVAAVRRGVRVALPDHPGGTVLVACSGGADSLALLSATIFELKRSDVRVIGAVVDHGLQDGSAEHTARVVEQMAKMGAHETASIRVSVDATAIGVEAGAREARYAALAQLATHFGAYAVLLGHTRDDQAETVLLGLARGSGGRSIAGMRRGLRRGDVDFVRPLLDVTREQTEAACRHEGLDFWVDPHNSDPRFLRARVRHDVMPILERELGPGVAATLARTAEQLRPDMELLDAYAEAAWADVRRHTERAQAPQHSYDVAALAAQPGPIRTRVLRLAALDAGAIDGELAHEHVEALDGLVTRWRGQRWIDLPGHLRAVRRDGRVHLEPAPRPSDG